MSPILPTKSATKTAALLDFGYLSLDFGLWYAARACMHLYACVRSKHSTWYRFLVAPSRLRSQLWD